ncbi:MAG: hypothetical protein OIN89_05010 [Candidatus Methanoperedens sp.]|jgi:hypothetical protein|nr:hypothetical protein [Candidatus Methanoperedens sp.]PKL52798.1 MAG: hypothetical protein CVV36_10585 [Candidatus Methanoperedenaceae archaeon HGW-Methanoperedenaceae-1]
MIKNTGLEAKANKIYESNKKDWESKYYGKVVAIDLETEKLAAVADSLLEVDELIDKLCPTHKVLVRKVGKKSTVARVFRMWTVA